MKRPRSSAKRTAAKRPRKPRSPAGKQTPISLDSAGADYVGRLAAAVANLSQAQNYWVADIDLASRQPGIMQDLEWQARSRAAINSLLIAANDLRIEPVPDAMRPVDDMLGRAQTEARTAADGYAAAVERSNAASLLVALRHIDRMGQLIQQAYALLRR